MEYITLKNCAAQFCARIFFCFPKLLQDCLNRKTGGIHYIKTISRHIFASCIFLFAPVLTTLSFNRMTGGIHYKKRCCTNLKRGFFLFSHFFPDWLWIGRQVEYIKLKNVQWRNFATQIFLFSQIFTRSTFDRETDGNALHVKTLPRSLSLSFPFF